MRYRKKCDTVSDSNDSIRGEIHPQVHVVELPRITLSLSTTLILLEWIQPQHILVHLSGPFARGSITLQLLESEIGLARWHDEYQAPWPYVRRAERTKGR